MELLHNGYTLDTPPDTFPLSTDSMLLADFARLPRDASVLDLGSGCGTLGLLLCAEDPTCHVTGIEIDGAAHTAALENIRRNALSHRLESVRGDLRQAATLVPAGAFHCCVSNPPYFSAGARSRIPQARHTDQCDMESLFAAASHAVKYGGDFYLVHKPDALAQLCAHAVSAKLEPKRLIFVRHDPGKPFSLILLHCRKGGRPGLKVEELCLFDENGQPTPDYRRIYHLGG